VLALPTIWPQICVSRILRYNTKHAVKFDGDMNDIIVLLIRTDKHLSFFLLCVNRNFNTHFVCYIFQFVYVAFAARHRQPIAVER